MVRKIVATGVGIVIVMLANRYFKRLSYNERLSKNNKPVLLSESSKVFLVRIDE